MEAGKAQIFELIPKIMGSIGAIGKGRRNAQQGYSFRGIDDLYNAVQGSLIEHGVFIVPKVIDRVREERPTRDKQGVLFYTTLTVSHTFYAPDGSSVEAVTIGEAMDSGDKSSNKAMSAAMKYALIETFSIPTEGDNDTENGSPEVSEKTPAMKATNAHQLSDADKFGIALEEIFDEHKWSPADRKTVAAMICKKFNIKTVIDVPANSRAEMLTSMKGLDLVAWKASQAKKKEPAKAKSDPAGYEAFMTKCEEAASASGLSKPALFQGIADWMEGNHSDTAALGGDAESQALILKLIKERRGFFAANESKSATGVAA